MSSVNVTIDGREIAVETGTTVLDAARRLGIEIPTLCHVEGMEPSASCFLCCVQIEGMGRLSPACALPVSDGMVVATTSEDIRGARKMALELLLSDHAGDCVAPCAASCPAGLDVSGFVLELAGGRVDRSMDVISDKLSLPGTLGRVCPRLCEESCRRCDYDREGLAIAALHRYASDRNETLASPSRPTASEPSGKNVAIVGAGPAGLSAAFYLRQRGHDCTLFDAHARPGGMLRYGIPEYRLPRAALDAEISVIEHLGAKFRMNARWGKDFRLEDLQREHDAVFLGIGAQLSPGLRCDGEDLAISGIGFLRNVAEGDSPPLGRRVVVVGGGNTAMDASRTALRLGAEVRVFYRRTRQEMPCLLEEVTGAEEEGIRVDYLVAPTSLRRLDNGHGLRMVCRRMELGEPDTDGRRRPVPIEGSEFDLDCDTVIAAVGQAVDRRLAESEGLRVTDWGLWTEERSLATNLPGIFAGGDAVLGADLAVRAVAAGRVAATSIDQYLTGRPVTGPLEPASIALRPMDDREKAAIFRGIEMSARVPTTTIDVDRRKKGFDEIDLGLEDERAREEATRCMTCNCRKCDGCTLRRFASEYGADPYRFTGRRRRFEQDTSHADIVFEPGKCIMCNACVEIAAAAGEGLGLSITGRGFDVSVAVPFDRPISEGLRVAADRCAQACPTGAIAIKSDRSCDLAKAPRCPLE